MRKKAMTKSIKILCLETATTNCSVALSFDGKTEFLIEDNDVKYSHAERLHVYIDQILTSAKLAKEDLDAIAVSKGPGSYTGLRIGVSAAKGLCYALGIPLISIPTLSSLAVKIDASQGERVIAMLDARRMEVYSAIFDYQGNQLRDTEAQVLQEDSFATYLDENVVHFIGNGVAKFQEICTHKNAIFITKTSPSSAQMCQPAFDKYRANNIEDVAYFEPYYLKDFIAGTPKKMI